MLGFIMLSMTVFCHALIAITIHYDREEDHKYHDYQGGQGFYLCILRLVLLGIFLLGIVRTSNFSSKVKEKAFLKIIAVSGTIYFISLPIAVMYTNNHISVFNKQSFIQVSCFFSQLIGIGVLYY